MQEFAQHACHTRTIFVTLLLFTQKEQFVQFNDPLVQACEIDPIKLLSISPLLCPPLRFVNIENKKHFGSNDTVTRCESGESLETRRDMAR